MSANIKAGMDRLSEPLPAKAIAWRVGSTTKDKSKGQALPYLTFKAVTDRLDELFSPAGWKVSFREIKDANSATMGWVCSLSIRSEDGDWITKENGADNSDIEPTKGGITDALKRACATWGIGRYLYDYEAQWMPLRNERYLTETPVLPDEFLPENERGKAKKTAKPEAKSEAKPAGKSEAKPDAKSEAKPEGKPEAKSEGKPEAEAAEVPAGAEGATEGISAEELAQVNRLVERVETKKAPKSLVLQYITDSRGKLMSEAAKALVRKRLNDLAG